MRSGVVRNSDFNALSCLRYGSMGPLPLNKISSGDCFLAGSGVPRTDFEKTTPLYARLCLLSHHDGSLDRRTRCGLERLKHGPLLLMFSLALCLIRL